MSVLEEKPNLADERKEKSVAQRKKEAQELKPVRNYPLAATSTSDFVKPTDVEDEEEQEDVKPAPKGKKDPQAELAKKNAAADAKRKRDLEQKRAAAGEEEQEDEEEETEEEETEDTVPAKVAPKTTPAVKK